MRKRFSSWSDCFDRSPEQSLTDLPLVKCGLSYDVVLDINVRNRSLKAPDLLQDAAGTPKAPALGFGEWVLASFVTAPDRVEGSRIAHTSCRRPHGPGPDALAWPDEVVEDEVSQRNHAHHQPYLTGDQIYADDTAGTLPPVLQKIGEQLVGGVETTPIGGDET